MSSQETQGSVPRSRGNVFIAIVLSLLTLFATPAIFLIILFPLGYLQNFSENFNPVFLMYHLTGLGSEMGAYYLNLFLVILFLALLGDLLTAFITWFLYRSVKLTTVTFAAAVVLQVIVGSVFSYSALQNGQKILTETKKLEQMLQQYAKVGEASFEMQGPFVKSVNGVDVSVYSKMTIIVPVDVAHAGKYSVTVDYSDSKNSVPTKSSTGWLDTGEQTVRLDFEEHESKAYGYFSPETVGGIAKIQLDYIAARNELDNMIPENLKNDSITQAALNSQGTELNGSGTAEVNKFIEQKTQRF